MNLPQGLLGAAGLIGLLVGLLLAGAPFLYVHRRLQRLQQQTQARSDSAAAMNRRNQAIVEGVAEGVLEIDRAARVRYANPAAAKLLGYDLEELSGLDYRVLIKDVDDEDDGRDAVAKIRYTTNISGGVGALLRKKNGEYRPVEYKMLNLPDNGVGSGSILVFRDIGERVRSDNLLKEMQSIAKVGGWEYDFVANNTFWTDAVYAIHDLPPGSPARAEELAHAFDPETVAQMEEARRKALEFGLSSDMRVQCTTARGRKIWLRIIVRAERRHGATARMYGAVQDITELVEAERQLREARDFLDLTLNAVPMPIAYVGQHDDERVVSYANKAMAEWLERPVEAMLEKPAGEVFAPESYAAMRAALDAAAPDQGVLQLRMSGVRGGANREFVVYLVRRREHCATLAGFYVIVYDLTEQKRLEARLLQAQKMEVIGQLTGGVAHDFNNLLGVIIGNLQLLERGVPDDPALSRKVHTAMRAAVRGADLTRRLLAFARRQMLDPVVLDLNRQLTSVTELMQRTLGDSIEVRMLQSPELWSTRVDPAQFENAVLNLAINARDAMPNGGKLTVRTHNVVLDHAFCAAHPPLEPGEFVSIAVSDTGVGIEADVLERVFEPFFTTKESGRGSGLGLAMVHGFAEQAGGVATIESAPGRGTTVTLLLPRCVEERSEHVDTIVTRFAPGGSETILVVEDDEDLRETTVLTLSQLGYRVIEAPNAAVALRTLASPQHIDLLFTDVMMPGGMLGPALAKRARELRPGLNVLFTTGYAASAAGLGSADVISKPYRNEELATRIRLMLDREIRVTA